VNVPPNLAFCDAAAGADGDAELPGVPEVAGADDGDPDVPQAVRPRTSAPDRTTADTRCLCKVLLQ